MTIVLVRGNLASYSHKYPWRVLVSGLVGDDTKQLNRFPSGGYSDESTIVYLQHPCVVLTALEVIGYTVIASSSTSVKQDYNEYMWTLRRDFSAEDKASTSSASLTTSPSTVTTATTTTTASSGTSPPVAAAAADKTTNQPMAAD